MLLRQILSLMWNKWPKSLSEEQAGGYSVGLHLRLN